MKLLDRITKVIEDLLTPRRSRFVGPPPPQSVPRYLVRQTLIAQAISGADSTLVEKALFVGGPLAIDFVARRGAEAGHQDYLLNHPGRRPGVIDVDSWLGEGAAHE